MRTRYQVIEYDGEAYVWNNLRQVKEDIINILNKPDFDNIVQNCKNASCLYPIIIMRCVGKYDEDDPNWEHYADVDEYGNIIKS